MNETATPQNMPQVLTAADRCDAAYAEQATTVFVRQNGETLMFCDHHSKEYTSKLQLLGYNPL